MLVDSGEVTAGYFSGEMTDVVHAGEYTTNTFQALRADFGYTARAVETALGVGAHLTSVPAPLSAPPEPPSHESKCAESTTYSFGFSLPCNSAMVLNTGCSPRIWDSVRTRSVGPWLFSASLKTSP